MLNANITGGVVGAQFGLSIASIGDHNDDGFEGKYMYMYRTCTVHVPAASHVEFKCVDLVVQELNFNLIDYDSLL